MARGYLVVALALAAFAIVAQAQPFTATEQDAGPFVTGLTEPAKRKDDNYTGFIFDFNTAQPSASDSTPNGNLTLNQGGARVWLHSV